MTIRRLTITALILFLAACGGGSSTSPVVPPVPDNPVPPEEPPQNTAGSSPADFFAAPTALYFSADDGVTGREPWQLTETGVIQLADLTPGTDSSDVLWMIETGGAVVVLTREAGEVAAFSTWLIRDTQVTRIKDHQFEDTVVNSGEPLLVDGRVLYRLGLERPGVSRPIIESEWIYSVDVNSQLHEELGQFDIYRNQWVIAAGEANFLGIDLTDTSAGQKQIWRSDGTLTGTRSVAAEMISNTEELSIAAANTSTLFLNEENRLWQVNTDLIVSLTQEFDGRIWATLSMGDEGLLVNASDSSGGARLHYVEPDGSATTALSAGMSTTGHASSGIRSDDELIYTVFNTGTAQLIHESLTTDDATVVKQSGGPICTDSFRLHTNEETDQIFLVSQSGGGTVCFPYSDRIESYNPFDRTLQPMVDLPGEAEDTSLSMRDFAFAENGVYYLMGSDAETSSLRHYSSVLGDDILIQEEILLKEVPSSGGFEGHFIEGGLGLFVVLDDGEKGLELWQLQNIDAELVADINELPEG